jgi:dihydroneopterin aldolase
LRLAVKLGVTEAERAFPQVVECFLELGVDSKKGSESDDLNDTTDYVAVIKRVQSVVENGEWCLVEKLQRDIAISLVNTFPGVYKIKIGITKNVLAEVNGVTFIAKFSKKDLLKIT